MALRRQSLVVFALCAGLASSLAAAGSARAAPASPARKTPARAPASAAPAAAPVEARLYLSWNAPWGAPRASTAIAAPCGDTTATDTLYLSFDPGKDAPGFVGASAVLYFEAAQGAELPAAWKRGTATAPPVRVVFESDPARGFVTPWSAQGAGAPFYDVLAGRGRLRLIYAIAPNSGPGVRAGTLSGLARVLVPRAPAGADGCATPLCVEWSSASLAYSREEQGNVERGERWVTMNAPAGTDCARIRSRFGAQPWKPR